MSSQEASSCPQAAEHREEVLHRGFGRMLPAASFGLGAAVLAGVVVMSGVAPPAGPALVARVTTTHGLVAPLNVLADGHTTCCGQA